MTPYVTMRDFLTSPAYLGTPELMGAPSWRPWRTLLIAIRGEPLDDGELAEFRELTGRLAAPAEPVREFYGVVSAGAAASRELAPCWRPTWPRASTTGIFWRRGSLPSWR